MEGFGSGEPSQECLSRKWYVLSTTLTAPLHPPPPTKIQNQSISLRRKTQGPSLHLLVLGAGWAPVLQLGQHRELKAGVEGRGSGETSVGWLCGSRRNSRGWRWGGRDPPTSLLCLSLSLGHPVTAC